MDQLPWMAISLVCLAYLAWQIAYVPLIDHWIKRHDPFPSPTLVIQQLRRIQIEQLLRD